MRRHKLADLDFVIQLLIERGQGLALIRGLREAEIREIEDRIWAEFDSSNDARLAVALRFRALLSVFASRRLKALLLERGYRLLMAVGAAMALGPRTPTDSSVARMVPKSSGWV